jgi:hypothetical protein
MKTYLVSEEVLRQVLDELVVQRDAWYTTSAAIPPQLKQSIESLRTILAKEPSEPVAYLYEGEIDKFTDWFGDECFGYTCSPLYRKDA